MGVRGDYRCILKRSLCWVEWAEVWEGARSQSRKTRWPKCSRAGKCPWWHGLGSHQCRWENVRFERFLEDKISRT